jgi:hypothetical protein
VQNFPQTSKMQALEEWLKESESFSNFVGLPKIIYIKTANQNVDFGLKQINYHI